MAAEEVDGPYQIRYTKPHYWAKLRHDALDLFSGRRWIVYEGHWMIGNFGRMRKSQAIRTRDSLNYAYFKGLREGKQK